MELDAEIIKWGGYVLSSVLGWFVRVLWTAQDQMRKDFSSLEANLPLAYVRKDELREIVRDIKDTFKESSSTVVSKLTRIEDKLEEHRQEMDAKFVRKVGQ